jgi:hypothetical protein
MSWATILWILFAALASAGLGGYIAGRLRVKWPTLRTDEVYFRDTAHGFLAWAVATLLAAAVLTSVIGNILGAGATIGAGTTTLHAEIARIFDSSLHAGPLSADDRRYAAQLVAQRTGLSQQDADARVTAAYTAAQETMQRLEASAKAAVDKARKAAAYAALWIFVSLPGGAFFASLMATVGGRQRDMF